MSEAFHSIAAVKNVPLFIFGDHASKHIPKEYDHLGLSGDDLTRHIAWDIGTETILRYLCEHFGCGGQLAKVSRLVIDLNRELEMAGLIPAQSDGTVIPANQSLSPVKRQDRIARFYTPYHAALGAELDKLEDPFVLSVHSFTPKPDLGEQRDVDIGLLVKHDAQSAEQMVQSFAQSDLDYMVAINEPYSAYDLNHTVDANVAPRGLRHLAIEIRQDHINTKEKACEMARVLAVHLEPFIMRKPHQSP